MRCLGVLVLLASIGTAHADRATAERYFHAGEKAYRAQNFGAAAQNFEDAYKQLALPEIAFSAAQAYRRQYRVDPKPEYVQRSVDLYQIYLDKVKTGGRVGDAADSLGEMQRELDKLVARGTKITAVAQVARTAIAVSIRLAHEDASLETMQEVDDIGRGAEVVVKMTIDDQPVQPYTQIDVKPGDHKVRAEAPGYLPAEKTEPAVEGVSSIAELTLQPRPAKVTLATEAGARIRIDGRVVGVAPLVAIDLPAGHHVIGIARKGRETVSREVTVTRGQELTITQNLEKTLQRRAVPWVSLAAGGVAVFATVSAIGAVVEDNHASDMRAAFADPGNRPPSDYAEYSTTITRRDHLFTGAFIAGGAAVVLGATALGLYLFDSPSEDSVRVVPVSSATSAGLAVLGRF